MKIAGIMLVRNENLFVAQALRNVLNFCDVVHVADHQSVDGTSEILQELQREFPEKVLLKRIAHPRESHQMIRPYAGTDTWVFGIDGDEIYDPAALARFRTTLAAGVYDAYWAIFGNVLNVKHWNPTASSASGHLAPPCRSMTKLYNFRLISDWSGRSCIERLHGGTVDFLPGYHDQLRCDLYKDTPWDETDFRCLHLCFLRRSSKDAPDGSPRKNIMDIHCWTLAKIAAKVRGFLTGQPMGDWKEQRYARGPVVEKSYLPFFPEGFPPVS